MALQEILRTNLIVGDMLNGKDQIFFVEYTTPVKGKFKRRVYALTDMENSVDKALVSLPIVNYTALTPLPEYSNGLSPTIPANKQSTLLKKERT